MEFTKEVQQKIAKKSVESTAAALRLFKIDFFSLPKDMQKAVMQVYVAGCEDSLEFLKDAEKGVVNEQP